MLFKPSIQNWQFNTIAISQDSGLWSCDDSGWWQESRGFSPPSFICQRWVWIRARLGSRGSAGNLMELMCIPILFSSARNDSEWSIKPVTLPGQPKQATVPMCLIPDPQFWTGNIALSRGRTCVWSVASRRVSQNEIITLSDRVGFLIPCIISFIGFIIQGEGGWRPH